MSQNPYSSDYMQGGQAVLGERKMSILAVTSLVFGILSLPMCCVMGIVMFTLLPVMGDAALVLGVVPGVLALTLGIAAVVQIRGSMGRRSGMGLAITGIVLGLLSAVLWAAAAIGVNMAIKELARNVDAAVHSIETTDPSKLKLIMTTSAAPRLTDASVAQARAQLKDKAGAVQGLASSGMGEWFKDFFGYIQKNAPGRSPRGGQPFPMAVRMKFEKQNGYVVGTVDQNDVSGGGPFVDLRIELDDGTKIDLLEPAAP
jgi:hypothetical protein